MAVVLLLSIATPAGATRPSQSSEPPVGFVTSAAGTRQLPAVSSPDTPTPQTSYNAHGLQKEVFAFAPHWALNQESSWDYNVMSTIAYFAITLNYDGTWYTQGGGWQGYYSSDLVDMISRAHAAGDRVQLVITTGGTASINDIVTVPSVSQTAIGNIVGAVANRGFDGVNIDFEGSGPSATYPNIQTGLTSFMGQLSAAMHQQRPGSQVTIDTYSGAASWDDGLFRIDTLAPNVDAMFIMAYDMSFSNMSGHAGPNAPINGWTYNDTLAINQYLTKAPASKIILGVPWYGYLFTTSSNATYAAASRAQAVSYHNGNVELTCGNKVSYGWDAQSQTPWAAWYSPRSNDPCGDNLGSWVELWYDNPQSLGIKYGLVNAKGIRGMGVWALGYDGGLPEMWSTLNTYFSCPASATVDATQATTEFSVSLSAGTCNVSYYDVQEYDVTNNAGWFTLPQVKGSATGFVAQGYPGNSYQFRARSHSKAGVVSAWSTVTTDIDTTATNAHPYQGLYTQDMYGGLYAAGSPPLKVSAYWAGQNVARAGHATPGTPASGAILDAYGGLHPYGAAMTIKTSAYWPGWKIARDFAFLPDGSGGYVLDGYGNLHPFSTNGKPMPAAATTGVYWAGWDIARKVVIFSDGTGGYVLDGWGGIHPFGIGANPRPPAVTAGYWPHWDIIHDLALIPGTHAGYQMDGFGGIHPFAPTGQPMPPAITSSAYWPNWDIARAIVILGGSTLATPGGYVLDGYGGYHKFGSAPNPPAFAYWPGRDIARDIAGY